MAEVSDREYDFLIRALDAQAAATDSVKELVGDVRLDLERRFLTKDEDDKHDDEKHSTLKEEVMAALDGVKEAASLRISGQDKVIKILCWVVGIEGTFILALLGHVAGFIAPGGKP